MKDKGLLSFMKGAVGLFAFALLITGNANVAKADTTTDAVSSDTVVTKTGDIDDNELDTIMSAIDGKELSDGDSFTVDGYKIDCEIIIEPTSGSAASSSDILCSTLSTTSNSYRGTCNVYITGPLINACIAVITHTVNVTNYSSGLVHINAGEVAVQTLLDSWTGSAYGYTITNTDGSYSSANGMVQLYNTAVKDSVHYMAFVSVTPGNLPSFTFSKA